MLVTDVSSFFVLDGEEGSERASRGQGRDDVLFQHLYGNRLPRSFLLRTGVGASRTKKLGVIRVSDEHPRMDWTRIHLALNHLPVIGIPFLVLMLLVGGWRKSNELTRFALWSLMIIAGVAIAIKFTGDFAAEQSVVRLAGAEKFVSHHEETGDQVTTAVFILGLSAALALFLARSGRPIRRWTIVMVLLLGLVAGLLYARTAHSGGQISHPELRSAR